MKALTVWQPWAALIAEGWKRFEFRGWEAPRRLHGHRIAIHAGARPVRPAEIEAILARVDDQRSFLDAACVPFLQHMPIKNYARSCLVAVVRLGWPLPPEALAEMCNDSDRAEHYQWAWPVEVLTKLPNIPCRGRQGFWNVGPDTAREIAARLERT